MHSLLLKSSGVQLLDGRRSGALDVGSDSRVFGHERSKVGEFTSAVVVGRVLEIVGGEPFESCPRRKSVLDRCSRTLLTGESLDSVSLAHLLFNVGIDFGDDDSVLLVRSGKCVGEFFPDAVRELVSCQSRRVARRTEQAVYTAGDHVSRRSGSEVKGTYVTTP